MVHKGSNKCIRQSYRISIAIIFADTCILRLSNFAGCILLSAGSRGLVLSHFWGRSKPTWRRSVWSGIFYWLVRNMTGIYYIYIGENWVVIVSSSFLLVFLSPVATVSRGQDGCPVLAPGTIGICSELCTNDGDCTRGQKCCSNGCGHQCTGNNRGISV